MKKQILMILLNFMLSLKEGLKAHVRLFDVVLDGNVSRKERRFAAYSITVFVLNLLFIIPNLISEVVASLVFSIRLRLRKEL